MPAPTSLSEIRSEYIEAFLLGIHDKAPELKHTLFGLFSVVTPEEIIEKASLLYSEDKAYQSLRKRKIVQNIKFLIRQFIFIHTPYGSASFHWKRDEFIRPFFQDLIQQLSDFKRQVAQYEKMVTTSTNSFSFDNFIKEDLKKKISTETVMLNAEKLARDLQSHSMILLLNIKPCDVYEYNDRATNSTMLAQSLRGSQKITDIIIYDLLWNASSVHHRYKIARFYLETLKCCLTLHDYHSAIAIYIALSQSDIERLEPLNEIHAELKEFSNLFNVFGEFSALRSKLKELREEKFNKRIAYKIIPYLAIYTQRLMQIKGAPYEEKWEEELTKEEIEEIKKREIKRLSGIGKICDEIKYYQSHLNQFTSQRRLYGNFLERSFEADRDKDYERSRQLCETSKAKKVSAQKEYTKSLLEKFKDFILLSPPALLPEQRFALQDFLPLCNSRTSITYSEERLEEKPAFPLQKSKTPRA